MTRIRPLLVLLAIAATFGLPGGRLRAASATLVISEFRTRGPNGAFDEFIEIRNVSAGAINLSGWNVVGSNGNGQTAVRANLAAVSLRPGCSWLLGNSQPSSGYTGPVDQTYGVGLTDDGGIALQNPGGQVVDSVGMSSGSAFGEGGRLSPLTSSTNRSYERVGADTDNNTANFTLRSPSTPTTSGGGCTGPAAQPTPPTATGAASPANVNQGQSVLLTATVTPGANPTSTGVTVAGDVSPLGGGTTQPFFDNGTNGDAVAGDRVFSFRMTIGAGISGGTKTIGLLIGDSQARHSFANIVVSVAVPTTPPTATAAVSPSPFARQSSIRIQATATPGGNPTSTALAVSMNLSVFGRPNPTALSDAGGGVCDLIAGDRIFTACVLVPLTTPIGALTLTGTVSDGQGRASAFSVNATVSAPVDSDGDGASDACETTFGLNPSSSGGNDGGGGDPDGDGHTNAQECAAQTHPRGLFTRYLAEGVTNSFFRTRIALFNPSATAASALVRIQPEGQPEQRFVTAVPARSRRTITPEDTATFGSAPFATVVESDVELVVDRMMMWGPGDYGSHAETAVKAPSTTWFLAEGATGWRFSLFYLLQNPSDQSADVEVNFLRGPGEPVLTRTYAVGGGQRRTIPVDEEEFPAGSGVKPLAGTDVSARIQVTNGVPIIVERAMYMSPDDQPFGAGHAAAGIAAPSTDWFFAEGPTGTFFDEYILLANGGSTPAHVTVTFTPEGGAPISRPYEVAPNSRSTIWVDQIPGLQAISLSARVTSDVPIAAERAMWWPGTGESWREAHVSAGATTTGPTWAVADLELGGPNNAQSFVLIYNGGSATVYFDDGTAPIACGSSGGGRYSLHVNGCAAVQGHRFVSVVVHGNANTVVERAVYLNTGGQTFGAGGAALGTQIP